MREKKLTYIILFLLVVVATLVVLLSFSESSTNAPPTPIQTEKESVVPPIKNSPEVTNGWKSFSAQGITIKTPSYVSVRLGTSLRNILATYDFILTPNPNIDFATFSTKLQIISAQDFVLDLSDKFLSYNPSNQSWYMNKNLEDKPNKDHNTYQHLYDEQNAYVPKIFGTTHDGVNIFGPFVLGDTERGKMVYLIPIQAQNKVLSFELTYNLEAVVNSSASIKKLKVTFDSDLPLIMKSVSLNP